MKKTTTKKERENWSVDDPKDPQNWSVEKKKKYNSVWAIGYKDTILHDTPKLTRYDMSYENYTAEQFCKSIHREIRDLTLFELNDLLYSACVRTIEI